MFNFDEFPYLSDSYPSDWVRTLEAAEALEADIFVPGHGFLPDNPRDTRQGLRRHRQGLRRHRQGLRRHRQILLDVRQVVQEQLERGATEDQAVANANLPQYRRFQGYSRAMEIAVRRTYRELTGVLD